MYYDPPSLMRVASMNLTMLSFSPIYFFSVYYHNNYPYLYLSLNLTLGLGILKIKKTKLQSKEAFSKQKWQKYSHLSLYRRKQILLNKVKAAHLTFRDFRINFDSSVANNISLAHHRITSTSSALSLVVVVTERRNGNIT